MKIGEKEPVPEKGEKGRFPRVGRPFFFLPLLFCLGACAPAPPMEAVSPGRMVPDVPFFPQELYQCGPASLAGVLNFWGVPAIPEEIARAIYSPTARGTLDLDMLFYAEMRGLKARQYAGGREDLQKNIAAGIPLIVLVDEGFLMYQRHHFMVVIGYDARGIFANSGRERHLMVPWGAFLQAWGKTKNWTLRVTSP